jgi:hypothetical protein
MPNSYNSTSEVMTTLQTDWEYKSPFMSTMWKEFQPIFTTTKGWDRGNTVQIALPNQYLVGDGETISSFPDTTESKLDLTVNYRKHIAMNFTTQDMTLYSKFKFDERFINPATDTLADFTESVLSQEVFNNIYLLSGTAGVAPSSYNAIAQVKSKMSRLGIPARGRWMAFDDESYTEVISSGTLQNSFDMKLTRDINREAQLGRIAQFQTFSSSLFYQHQAGIGDGTLTPANGLVGCGTVKTLVPSGDQITLTGLPVTQADTLRVGDKLIFTGVYHPQPKVLVDTNLEYSVSILAVSNGGTTDGSGEITITISNPIESGADNPKRNISDVTGLPAGTPAFLVTANSGVGSATKAKYKLNYAYIKNALIFAAPPLAEPQGIPANAKARRVDPDNGLSMRMYTFTDGSNDKDLTRLDVLFGIKIYGPLIFGLLG